MLKQNVGDLKLGIRNWELVLILIASCYLPVANLYKVKI